MAHFLRRFACKSFFMKFNLLLIVVFTLAAGFTSCRKKSTTTVTGADYLIAGQTGGFVMAGTQSPYYLVKDGTLKADTSLGGKPLPSGISGFNFNYSIP